MEAYQKIADLLPADAEGNIKQTREQVRKLISNVESGVGNLKNPAATQVPEQPASEATLPVAPAGPNASPLTTPGQ